MGSTSANRIVWLYYGDHQAHPFIRQGVSTLLAHGFLVTVYDRAKDSSVTGYEHLSGHRQHRLPFHRQVLPESESAFAQRGRVARGLPHWALKHILFGLEWRTRRLFDYIYNCWFFMRGWWVTLRRRPAIIICTMPIMAYLGYLVARVVKCRLVYYPFELFGEQYLKPSRWMMALERRLLQRHIDALITQNNERARIYVEERGACVMPIIVHNYKVKRYPKTTGKLYAQLQLNPHVRIVLYEGYLIPGRWLEELVQAARYFPRDTHLVLMGRTSDWWKEIAPSLLADKVLQQKVLQCPGVPHEQLLDYVTDAHAGIIIYDDTLRNNYYCEPGKLSDYVLAGVPVVAPAFPTIKSVIERFGIGETFASADPREIARAIIRVIDKPKYAWAPALDAAREQLHWGTQEPAFLRGILGERADAEYSLGLSEERGRNDKPG